MRESMVFYGSFLEAVEMLPEEEQAKVVLAIIKYGLRGEEATEKGIAAAILAMAKPQIEANNRRYESGKRGGRPKKDDEDMVEEVIIESESIEPVKSEEKKPKPEKEVKHKHGENGWVRLTEKQYNNLLNELGQKKLDYYIKYLDEYAQSNGNKNKWKDWNMVLRRAVNENWGKYVEDKRADGVQYVPGSNVKIIRRL